MPLEPAEIAAVAGEPDVPADFSVYDATGAVVHCNGPDRIDTPHPTEIVVVSPISDRQSETVVGLCV